MAPNEDMVFKALADRSRRKLLDRLYEKNGLTLNEISKDMGMSRQAVSQHLTILESANLISTRWDGREKLHYLNPVPIHEIYERWVRKFEQRGLKSLHDLKKKIEGGRDEQDGVRLRDIHQRKPGAGVEGAD